MGVVLPDELAWVLDLIGIMWPNVDEDDYREMADSLREFASDIDTGVADAHGAVQEMLGSNAWDVPNRLTGTALGTRHQVLQQRDYAYRADGRLLGVDDRLAGGRALTLDRAGRVTAVEAAGWTETYAYDACGNLTGADWPAKGSAAAALGARGYEGSLVTTAGRIRYEYDGAGRMTLRQKLRLSKKPDTWRYTWDAEDRLTDVTMPDGTRWHYLYDAFDRRIAKQRLSPDGSSVVEWTDFSWDGPVLAEQTTHAPYLPGPHTLTWDHRGLQPLAQTETITTADGAQEAVDRRFFAIVTDLVGTPTELVDLATETIAWRTVPTVWGTTTWPSGSGTYTPLRFPGQYFDPETRLHYNVHRHYDPETARYATPDPLGLVPAPNARAYVADPLLWSDPLGLAPKGPKDPMNLGGGYRGRMDVFPMGQGSDFEIHVYKNGQEVGIFGSEGWISKHRKGEAEVPEIVMNRLKGHAVKFMRNSQPPRIGPRGTEDITGDQWMRPRLKGNNCKK